MALPAEQGQFAAAAAAVYHFMRLNNAAAHAAVKLPMEYPHGHFCKQRAAERIHAAAHRHKACYNICFYLLISSWLF